MAAKASCKRACYLAYLYKKKSGESRISYRDVVEIITHLILI